MKLTKKDNHLALTYNKWDWICAKGFSKASYKINMCNEQPFLDLGLVDFLECTFI